MCDEEEVIGFGKKIGLKLYKRKFQGPDSIGSRFVFGPSKKPWKYRLHSIVGHNWTLCGNFKWSCECGAVMKQFDRNCPRCGIEPCSVEEEMCYFCKEEEAMRQYLIKQGDWDALIDFEKRVGEEVRIEVV